ncbi:MAG: NADH-quinone oxidoreductase subunit L [Pseudomonadota bacterium]|nr:NADH-quinone oxidoreductase subunit L [Pseudomonadota bacterium]
MGINSMAILGLLSPLVGALVSRMSHQQVALAKVSTIGGVLVSWLVSLALFRDAAFISSAIDLYQFSWLDAFGYRLEIGFWLDALSLMMMVIITSVSLLVHIYSIGYMQGDERQGAYFSYVSFFTFAMLLLVMSNNLLQVFMGWEGVGVASYLLIGFWQKKSYPAQASIKAFLVNRVGDMGLVVATGLIFYQLGSISYGDIISQGNSLLAEAVYGFRLIDCICLALLIAAMGKSAQMPLQVWLPDSMAGPTPISALIHAATMVTAGIYLICRFAPWFEISSLISFYVKVIGFSTMILMGLVALVESDIKKIIAYSTLSQLGMMIGICGALGYVFSLYHLATHAAFKALLFLGAGAIIMAANHEQNIFKIGAMRASPTIHLSMLVGLLSMMAVPPLSGFFSKDAMILLSGQSGIYGVMLLGALITALYSTRLYFWLFWQPHIAVSPKKVPLSMRWPLWVLMVLSVYQGYAMVPFLETLAKSVSVPIDDVVAVIEEMKQTSDFIHHAMGSFSLTLILLGSTVFFLSYWTRPGRYHNVYQQYHKLWLWVQDQYGMNTLYTKSIVRLYQTVSLYFWGVIDQKIIDKRIVLGTSGKVSSFGLRLSRLVDGKLYHYVAIMFLGLLLLLLGLV